MISVYMAPEDKAKLNKVCADRGMTIKSLQGRLLSWFVTLDRTEQSIVLGQIEASDVETLADLIGQRRPQKRAAAAGRGIRGARHR